LNSSDFTPSIYNALIVSPLAVDFQRVFVVCRQNGLITLLYEDLLTDKGLCVKVNNFYYK